jgi:hypothetical protein
MTDLLASLDSPPSGRRRAVWFDNLAYCRQKLLAGRPVPWDSPGELAAFYGKAQDMFGSDALLLDLTDLYAQQAADDRLRQAMAARSRPGYPLRALLGDDTARAHAQQAVIAVTAGRTTAPTVLALPAPARWLSDAAAQAGQEPAPPDPDRAETAAVYVADLLRIFAGAGVDGLLLDEGPTAAADLVPAPAYQPVLNLAAHYDWPVFVRTDAAPAWPHGAVPGVAGWLGSAPPRQAEGRWGLVAGEDLWADADGDLMLATVPADGDPETIMRKVGALL